MEELWLYSYNPVTKTYRMDATTGRSLVRNFTFTIRNNVWSFTGTNTNTAGVTTLERFAITFSEDGASANVRSEHSVDGKAWFERLTGTYTRAPAGG